MESKKILEAPGQRKIHQIHTPSMGGIPIFLGTAFSLIIWLPSEDSFQFKYLFAALVITFVIGLRDDLIPLKPIYKLLSQIIPALVVIYLFDIQLTSLYGLIDNVNFSPTVSWLITLFVIIVITNSINLIDGLDGLAGTVSLISLTCMGAWFYFNGYEHLSYILFSFVGSIIAFLLFNWQPSKIFMGDTGALLIGFLLSCSIIIFINYNFQLGSDAPLKFNASVTTAICFIIMPLLDTLRVFVLRVSAGKSPLHADNNHIHHMLIRLGLSHSWSVIVMGGVNMIFVLLALGLRDYTDTVALPIVLMLCILFTGALSYLSKTKAQKAAVK